MGFAKKLNRSCELIAAPSGNRRHVGLRLIAANSHESSIGPIDDQGVSV
jgi:hypothetical protein